ncbi:hypothetical protein [Collimonas humicola]|uniref:hypothetical protein n=1 Tax=Collimonas humicola TaxID=2825886 RepID=UPI001B8CE240|nr:hypothetical protein [Collimonas humicola]
MPVISQNPQQAARRFTLIVSAAAIAIALSLVIAYLAIAEPGASQAACIAAHAAERGVSTQQLTGERRYQQDLVKILSVCSGMAP